MPQLHQDRRRFIRHPLAIPLRCQKEGHETLTVLELRDMSYGGLAFFSTETFEAGDFVRIHFPDIGHPCTVRGEIVWTERMGDGDRAKFLNGMRFCDEDSHFRGRLIEQLCHIESYRRIQEHLHGRKMTPGEAAEEWIARQAGRFPP